jgi:Bacteriophage related domain of unknown function
MSLVSIRAALETALLAMTPAIATAPENTPYTPTVGVPYQRIYLLAAEPLNPEMGTHTTERGFLQVSLAYPLNTGPAAATARAELIRDTFYRGRSFVSGGVTTIIEKTPEIAPAMIEADRYVLPVRIRFFANYRP